MHAPPADRRRHRLAALAVASGVLGMVVPADPATAVDVLLSAPAAGPVVRWFEEPVGAYAPGHRGLDIGVAPGTPVRAAADGTVAFAGVVAGDRFVTLTHPGPSRARGGAEHERGPLQLETTYSFLSRIDVRPGEAVHTGAVIGASGAGHPGVGQPALHFAVRIDGRYVDPAPLLGLRPVDVSDLVALGPLPDEEAVPRTTPDLPPGAPSTQGPPLAGRRRNGPTAGALPPSAPDRPGASSDPPWVLWGPPRPPAQPGRPGRPGASGPWGASEPSGPVLGDQHGSGPGRAAGDPAGPTRSAGSSGGLAGVLARRLACIAAGSPPPPALPTAAEVRGGVRPPEAPNDNVVIAVAGIGSSTWPLGDGSFGSDAAMYLLDLRTLGYAGDRIFHFSYRGVPDGTQGSSDLPYRFHLPYTRGDTFQPIAASAALLEQLVERVHAAHPGRRIDIVAHSQGGIVAQYYLERLHDSPRPGGPQIDHLVTIASPHRGADLAGLAPRLGAAGTSLPGRRTMDRFAAALGAPPPSSPAARDLAVGSPLMEDLARRWTATVRTTTIGAGLDLVVPAQRTRLPGAAHYTVDLPTGWSSLWAHTAIVGADATRQIVYGALSDHPAPCTPLQDAMADLLSGPLVSAMAGGLLDALTAAAGP